jgi:PAS domain S-box-containing protein
MDNQGIYRWFQWNTRGIYDNTGTLVECQSVGRDINTERMQAQKIRESEERFHMITDHSPFPISIIDESGNYLYVNTIFTKLFGYTLEDIPMGKDWFSRAFPDISERREAILTWKKDLAQSITGEVRPCVFPVTCKDGTVRQINFFRATLASGEQFVVYEDLTPKKESERLHSVLASIVNSSNDAITLYRSLNNSSLHQR